MRLLPKNQDWTPYAYLVYLVYFAFTPFMVPMPPWQRIAVAAGTVSALALYFWGYWLRGSRGLWVIGAFVLLGTLFAPINFGASVFYVYAASFMGKAFDGAAAWRWLGALLVLIAIEAWALHFSVFVWIPALVFSALIGSIVNQQVHSRRMDLRLLRAQEETERMAKVAERERISRDLHDLLGHTLSVIVLKSELASRLTATSPERAAEEIRDVERISREALTEVRAAVRGYRSLGFESEVRAARQILETAGVRVESDVEPSGLSVAQENVAALALREAVTNVLRHAEATCCRLSLRRKGQFCELEIADDGRGGAHREGSGLAGMRERVEALGGVFECDGSRGTLLRIRMPV
jgi:two-component system sensor histidine kinase DesK